jgi:hypothetical protein
VPSVEAEPAPALPLPAAEPAVPTEELDWPLPADVPPVPSVEAEPAPALPLPAAEPAVPTDELDCPPPAEVPPVPNVDAEPEPEAPADDPPVPTDELDIPPPAEVPPVPIVELDCASTNAALPARNVAVNAASERFRLLISPLLKVLLSICECRMKSPVRRQGSNPMLAPAFPQSWLFRIEKACSSRVQLSPTARDAHSRQREMHIARSPACAGLLHRDCGSHQWTMCAIT